MLETIEIKIFTDGSCNTEFGIGAWVAVILFDNEKIIIQGTEISTTHNRMELISVIKAVNYVIENLKFNSINVFSDSQYVVNLTERKEKLIKSNFITKKGNMLNNYDLLIELINLTHSYNLIFSKVKAHQKQTDETNFNIIADKLSRKLVRNEVQKIKNEL